MTTLGDGADPYPATERTTDAGILSSSAVM